MNQRATAISSAVVLGAGLMGRLMAVQLLQAGWQVEVHEAQGPDAQGAAARVAAAMLAPLAESAITEGPVVRMGMHALKRWPQLLATLEKSVYFQREGTLIIWHRQDAAEASRFARQMRHTAQQIPELPAAAPLDSVQLASLEPELAQRFAQGLYLPGEGQLDNRQLLSALLHEMEILGARVYWNSPKDATSFTPGRPGHPDWVLDCRGTGARAAWAATSPLRGVRGEVVRLHAPEVQLSRPTRLVHPRYPIYIAPKEDHVFVIGATEIESEDDSPVSVRSTLELLSAAYTVHSGFAEARILEAATQLRPTLPDNLPAMSRVHDRVLQINGLYRHGFLIAPALLDAAMEILTTNTTTLAAQWQIRVHGPT